MWVTKRAISLHLAVVIFVPTFLALGWWQLHRALNGNGLSWAYTFEWPIFAAYALYLWWRIVHEQEQMTRPAPTSRRGLARAERRARADAHTDLELDAYNKYLASFNDPKNGARKDARP